MKKEGRWLNRRRSRREIKLHGLFSIGFVCRKTERAATPQRISALYSEGRGALQKLGGKRYCGERFRFPRVKERLQITPEFGGYLLEFTSFLLGFGG